MEYHNLLNSVLFIFVLTTSAANAYIRLHTTTNEEIALQTEAECPQGVIELKQPIQVNCACVKGIYNLFGENCTKPLLTLAGSHSCFRIGDIGKITRLEYVSPSHRPSLTILDGATKYVRARYSHSTEYPLFRKGDTLIAVQTWTIITKEGEHICLEVPEKSYCSFEKVPKFAALRPGCHGDGKSLAAHTQCGNIHGPNDFNEECGITIENDHHHHSIQKRQVTTNSTAPANTTSPTNSSGSLPPTNATSPTNGTTPTNGTAPTARKSLLPAPPPAPELDEDFTAPPVSGSEIVKSQLYAYLVDRGAGILNLGVRPTEPKTYRTPAYQILHLAKEVIKKTCPTYYVNHEHWEMAVASFLAMQQKHFRFRENTVQLQELKRIESALKECANASVLWPFLDPNNASCINGTTEVIEPGRYFKFNEKIDMNVDWGSSSRHTEPIIETVWKIFVHVHSQCYEYFDSTRTKDNGTEYQLPKRVYSGLLGDAWALMDNVDYCSLSARLDSTYPWDLPRPTKKQILPPNYRRKRELLTSGFGTCSELGRGAELCSSVEKTFLE